MEFSVLDACEDAKPEFKNHFDLVMLFDVFHDVAYPNKLIRVVYEMLTDGGKFLVLDVPTHGSLTENIKQAAGMRKINCMQSLSPLVLCTLHMGRKLSLEFKNFANGKFA